MNGETCARCHYGQLEGTMVMCRRFPPTLLAVKYVQVDQTQVELHHIWMDANGWCGEFKVRS